MSDIVQRMREGIDPLDIPEGERTMDAAADEIEHLRELRKHNANVIKQRDDYSDELEVEIERLRTSNAKLLAALHEVRDATAMPLPDPGAHSWQAFYSAANTRLIRCTRAARAAIERAEGHD